MLRKIWLTSVRNVASVTTKNQACANGKQLTKLLNGSISTPWEFQGEVDSSTLVDRTAVSMQ